MGHVFQMPVIIWSTITQNALSSGKQEVGSFSSVKKTEISVQHDKSQISETRLAMQSFAYQNPQFPVSLDSSLLSKKKPTSQFELPHRAWASPQTSSRKRSSSLGLPRSYNKVLGSSLNRRVSGGLMIDWWEKQIATAVSVTVLTIRKLQRCWNQWSKIQNRILVLRWPNLFTFIINVKVLRCV